MEFKQEIQERFAKSDLNKVFKFPRIFDESDDELLYKKKVNKYTEQKQLVEETFKSS